MPYKLTVLRPKGEVPLDGAQLAKMGRDRLQVTPSPKELLDSRPPYVFIADQEMDRNSWFEAIEQMQQQMLQQHPDELSEFDSRTDDATSSVMESTRSE